MFLIKDVEVEMRRIGNTVVVEDTHYQKEDI